MSSQFERRKAKEAKVVEQIIEKRDAIRQSVDGEKKEVKKDLTETSFDVILGENGKYKLVVIKYDLESGIAEVVETKPVTRDIGIVFQQKKTALKTLANLK